jgi:hypothetical protein
MAARKVWKFPVFANDNVMIPAGARILMMATQPQGWHLWAEVDPEQPKVARRVAIIGTGWDVPENHTHIHSWIDGYFVWHAYIEDEPDMHRGAL